MAAPIGNEYWKFRNKHGKDPDYNPNELWDQAVEYFEWMSSRVWNNKEAIKSGDFAGQTMDVPVSIPFSLKTFCLFADISHQTFLNYCEKEEYLEVTTRIRDIIETQQFEGATVGAYNPNIIARTLGLADRLETDVNVKPVQFNIIGGDGN